MLLCSTACFVFFFAALAADGVRRDDPQRRGLRRHHRTVQQDPRRGDGHQPGDIVTPSVRGKNALFKTEGHFSVRRTIKILFNFLLAATSHENGCNSTCGFSRNGQYKQITKVQRKKKSGPLREGSYMLNAVNGSCNVHFHRRRLTVHIFCFASTSDCRESHAAQRLAGHMTACSSRPFNSSFLSGTSC